MSLAQALHAPSTTCRSLRELWAVPLPRCALLRGEGEILTQTSTTRPSSTQYGAPATRYASPAGSPRPSRNHSACARNRSASDTAGNPPIRQPVGSPTHRRCRLHGVPTTPPESQHVAIKPMGRNVRRIDQRAAFRKRAPLFIIRRADRRVPSTACKRSPRWRLPRSSPARGEKLGMRT